MAVVAVRDSVVLEMGEAVQISPNTGEPCLEPPAVLPQDGVDAVRVVPLDAAGDLLQRNADAAERCQEPRLRQPVRAVPAVAGLPVDVVGAEEADPVVVPERLRRHPGCGSEPADAEPVEAVGVVHAADRRTFPRGKVQSSVRISRAAGW